MKKRIVSVVLACIMVLPLAGYQAAASSSDAKTISVSSLPEKSQLEKLLSWFEIYLTLSGSSDSFQRHNYDYREITKRKGNLFEDLVRSPMSVSGYYDIEYPQKINFWDIYPGKKTERSEDDYDIWFKSDKNKIDWIMLNILNCNMQDLSTLKSMCLNKDPYELNGFYYGTSYYFGSESEWPHVSFLSAKYDETYYYIKFKPYFQSPGDFESTSDYYATLSLKTINGKSYWSIYAISSSGFVSFPATSSVQTSGKCGDNVTWNFNQSNGTLTISGTGPMWDYTENLKWSDDFFEPELSGKAPGWYMFQDSIRQIVVTSGVTHIGDHAFQAEPDMDYIGDNPTYNGFSKLTTVKLADSVTSIGTGAFAHCNALSNISFGNGLTKIGDFAFSCCWKLKQVTLPSSLTTIGADAFRGTSLTSVMIPKSVKSVGSEAFGYRSWAIDYGFLPVNGFTIYGQAGSAAETYYKTLLNKYNQYKRDSYLVNCYPEDFDPSGTVNFIKTIAGFNDVTEKDWFANDVKYVVDKKLMTGTGNDLFSPNGKTTRGQAVTILYRLAGSPKVSGGGSFTDVKSGTWYTDAVQWAVKNGIASGYGNGRFGPNDTLNRQQLATMLVRYARLKNYDTKPSGDLSKFKDGNKVDSYAKTAMEWAIGAGLISGSSDGNLNPNGTATRAQLAAILHRFCENVTGTKATDTVLDKLLSKNPATGNKELALITAELSLKTYDNDGSNDESVRGYLTYDLGFDNANIYSNNYGGSLAFTLATKPYKGSDSDGNTDILVIVARGSQTPYELYMDKFTSAKDSYSSYQIYDIVKDFRNAIFEGLDNVVDPNKNYKVVVTGHSLGGASANLVAAQIIDGYEGKVNVKNKSKDVFCYTFGAIDSIVSDGTVYKGYEGIHNVTNYYDSFGPNGWPDFVSAAGNSRYGKFGHIDLFEKDIDKGANGAHKNHDMDTYRDAVRDGLVRFEKASDQKYADLSSGGGGFSGR